VCESSLPCCFSFLNNLFSGPHMFLCVLSIGARVTPPSHPPYLYFPYIMFFRTLFLVVPPFVLGVFSYEDSKQCCHPPSTCPHEPFLLFLPCLTWREVLLSPSSSPPKHYCSSNVGSRSVPPLAPFSFPPPNL